MTALVCELRPVRMTSTIYHKKQFERLLSKQLIIVDLEPVERHHDTAKDMYTSSFPSP